MRRPIAALRALVMAFVWCRGWAPLSQPGAPARGCAKEPASADLVPIAWSRPAHDPPRRGARGGRQSHAAAFAPPPSWSRLRGPAGWPAAAPRPRPRRARRRAVAAPPTVTAPPEVTQFTDMGKSTKWAECVVSSARKAEVWVFRRRDRPEFERLLHMRINGGYPPGGDGAERPVDFSAAGVSVQCRERAVDASLVCAECVKVLTGGAYGNGGIVVPAFPPRPAVLDCLELGGITAVEQGRREDGSPLITKITETGFCNSVNTMSTTVAT